MTVGDKLKYDICLGTITFAKYNIFKSSLFFTSCLRVML